jgi:hypothetical protein
MFSIRFFRKSRRLRQCGKIQSAGPVTDNKAHAYCTLQMHTQNRNFYCFFTATMDATMRPHFTLYVHCLSFLFPSYLNPLQPRPSILYVAFLFSLSFHCSCCDLFQLSFHNRYYLRERINGEVTAVRCTPGKVQV